MVSEVVGGESLVRLRIEKRVFGVTYMDREARVANTIERVGIVFEFVLAMEFVEELEFEF